MDETVIVIMLKDDKTGFLDRELGCYAVDDNCGLIYNAFATESPEGIFIYLKLTCGRDLEDWEYDAVFDYYDTDALMSEALSVEEEDGGYNPIWVAKLAFVDNADFMEARIKKLLELHKKELDSVYETIADKKEEYSE
ncbi:hypothetical protein IMSAG049_00198 [Clostridiales bacterium]|nr:hypothetical protein IMSAG049_00198 [Clostridiales bacterium]